MVGPLPSWKLYNDHWLHAYSISNTKTWRQHRVSYDPRDWDQWEKVAIYWDFTLTNIFNLISIEIGLIWSILILSQFSSMKRTVVLFLQVDIMRIMTASRDILASQTSNKEAVWRNGKWLWNQLWIVYEYSDVEELSYIPRYSTLTCSSHHVLVWIPFIRVLRVECARLIANQLKLSKLSTQPFILEVNKWRASSQSLFLQITKVQSQGQGAI